MERITFDRTGKQPLSFEGEYLSDLVEKVVWEGRKYSGELAMTKGGQYVVHIRYESSWYGEVNWDWAFYGSLDGVLQWVQTFDPMVPVKGFPEHVTGYHTKMANLEDGVRRGFEQLKGELCGALGPEEIE